MNKTNLRKYRFSKYETNGITYLYGLIWFMVIHATFNNISLYRGGQFCWRRKPVYREKTIDLSQAIDKIYHIMLYRVRHVKHHNPNTCLHVCVYCIILLAYVKLSFLNEILNMLR